MFYAFGANLDEDNGLNYPTDESIMAKIQAGNLDLLGVLYARYSKKAYRLCYRTVMDSEMAEDLVQEAFLRVLRYRTQFRGESRFSTWLYTIVRNVCLDHVRKRTREHAAVGEFSSDPTGRDEAMWLDTSEMSAVKIAFDGLQPEQKRLLVLSRVDGIGYKEIAEELGFTEGAVRVRIHRTLRKLKSDIDGLKEFES